MDDIIMESAEGALNIRCNERIRAKVNLPLHYGGLGIRRATDLSLPCYLSSLSGSSSLIKGLIPSTYHNCLDSLVAERAEDLRSALDDHDGPLLDHSQAYLDGLLCKRRLDELEASANTEAERARLRASKTPLSRKWLQALPSGPIGTLLTDCQFRVGVGLKLGGTLCQPHTCRLCYANVSTSGEHGLSCRRSQGRHPRHTMLNDEVKATLVKAQVPAVREPANLLRRDGRRPDGITLVPWVRGKCLMWDVTVADTLAPTYVRDSAVQAGAAATKAEDIKRRKYDVFSEEFHFVPLAFETLGSTSDSSWQLLKEIGRRLKSVSKDDRSAEFFLQRIALHIVRGNAASIIGASLEEEST